MQQNVISGAKITNKSGSDKRQTHSSQPNFHAMSIEKENSKEDFQKYFLTQEAFSDFATKCLRSEFDQVKCRWTAWRAFLGAFEVGDEAKIREKVTNDRNYYYGELDKFVNFRAKQQLDVEIDNPLSTNTKNPWNNFFEDNEIKAEIRKDVERTYQDVDFFYTKKCQDMLTNILFIWCKHNSQLSYRQGMNEIVGVLTYVCYIENFEAKDPENSLYDFLNDERCAEPDIFIMFQTIMGLNQKEMFKSSLNEAQDPKAKKKGSKASSGEVSRPNLPVVNRAVRIQEEYLPKLNGKLHAHLQKMGVEPQIYMIRWIRCMLSREFRVFQTLFVWDALFSYHYCTSPKPTSLDFLDYLCVAMLLYVSQQLIERDDSGTILGRLIKYPPVESIRNMIALAHEKVIAPLQNKKKSSTEQKKGSFTVVNDEDEEIQSNSPLFTSTRESNEDSHQNGEKEKEKVILFNKPLQNPVKKNEEPIIIRDQPNIIRDPISSQPPIKEPVFKESMAKAPLSKDFDPLSSNTINEGSNKQTGNKNLIFKKPVNAVNTDPLWEPPKQTIKTSQNPLIGGSPENRGQIGGDMIPNWNLGAQKEKNLSDKKEKSLNVAQKLEEGNRKAIQQLKSALESLKQENENNCSAGLEDIMKQLNMTLEQLQANADEIKNLK